MEKEYWGMFKMWYFYSPLDPDCYTLVYEATQKTTVLPPVNKTYKANEKTEHADENKYVQLLICSYADLKHVCKVFLCKTETNKSLTVRQPSNKLPVDIH